MRQEKGRCVMGIEVMETLIDCHAALAWWSRRQHKLRRGEAWAVLIIHLTAPCNQFHAELIGFYSRFLHQIR